MARNKKERIILNNIEIETVAAEGNAIARVDGKVLFVPQCVPGDIVDVQVNRKYEYAHQRQPELGHRGHKHGYDGTGHIEDRVLFDG